MNAQDLPRDASEESPATGLYQLRRERQPSHDLWPGIEAHLVAAPRAVAHRRPQPSLWPYALAASVCLALLAGVLLREQPTSQQPVAAAAPATRMAVEVAVSTADSGRAIDNRPYSNRDGQPARAVLLPRSLHLLRSESLDNAPSLVAEHAGGSGLMKATYSLWHPTPSPCKP